MNKVEMTSFEYAVSVLNEIASSESDSYIPFEIVWKTSLGLAKARTIIYNEYGSPVISETIGYEHIQQDAFNPSSENSDSFTIVRHSVFNYFHSRFGIKHKKLMARPDLLMTKLLELSEINTIENINIPEYSTIFDFNTLDNSINLSFIDGDSVEIERPVSLISKN